MDTSRPTPRRGFASAWRCRCGDDAWSELPVLPGGHLLPGPPDPEALTESILARLAREGLLPTRGSEP